MPDGNRCWRYNYRFDGKHKTLALGVHPDVSLVKASARHQLVRILLAYMTAASREKMLHLSESAELFATIS
jgi:hypothetical protein